MAVIKGLEWTFDTAAEVYEKMRPGYVEELYRDIFNIFLSMNRAMLLKSG